MRRFAVFPAKPLVNARIFANHDEPRAPSCCDRMDLAALGRSWTAAHTNAEAIQASAAFGFPDRPCGGWASSSALAQVGERVPVRRRAEYFEACLPSGSVRVKATEELGVAALGDRR